MAEQRVRTAYGEGRLLDYRNDAYTVLLPWATLHTVNVEFVATLVVEPGAGKNDALLQGSNGKPMFPLLYKLRQESQASAASIQPIQRIKKVSEQVKFSISQSAQQANEMIQQKDNEWNVSKQFSAIKSDPTATIKSITKSLTTPQYVRTCYGNGKVIEFREVDAMYVVELSFGILHSQKVKGIGKKQAKTLELNAAYEMTEKDRLNKLQAQCQELGIPFTEQTTNTCLTCLQTPKTSLNPALTDEQGNPLFPRLYKLRQSGRDIVTKQKRNDTPCLLCGSMTCCTHSSTIFRKEGITICNTCVEHLEYNFETAKTPEELLKHTQALTEHYSRAVLLLQYSSQFIMATAETLEQKTKQHNEIGVGSSSAGLVSGVLGVAAACSILTPAGPPLLVASLVFGGSATAVQTGSEAMKYYSEPNQLANRILALQGIVQTILATTKCIRDTTLLPFLDQAICDLNIAADPYLAHDKTGTAVRAGTRMGSTAATSVASLAAQEAVLTGRFMSRATTAAARTARFARFAGGALSAATLVLEARELQKTVDQINSGNPCEKANALRSIHGELNKLPSTTSIRDMWQAYTKVRSKQLFQEAVTSVMPRAEGDLELVEEVVSSLEATQDDGSVSSQDDIMSVHQQRIKLSGKSKLLERVKRFKEKEARKQAELDVTV